jgi:5-methylcytosine-specific restriction endonuclease McrA
MTKKKYNIERPFAGGTMSKAKYWGQIRSALRQSFRYWPPMIAHKKANRTKRSEGRGYDYHCEACSDIFKETEIQIDHIKPLGSLRSESDLLPFIKRLSAEEGYQILCKACHLEKTKGEKSGA